MNVDSSSPHPPDPFADGGARARKPPRGGRRIWSGTREVIAYGMPASVWRDLYYWALKVSWPVFFATLAALFVVNNTLFALLYLLGRTPIANQSPPGFMGAFFFSVETLATVGYGDMHPQTIYAHAVATLEIFVGMSGIALSTGLVFARFARPRSKIMFARHAIVRSLNGRMTLMVRAANARQNVIAEARAKMRLMRREHSSEGYSLMKIHDLKLVRSEHPIFLLGWNMMHVIDESSPLFGETPESLAQRSAMLLVMIEGSDETTAQVMQARHAWEHGDIRWHYRYVDLMSEVDGMTHIDYTRFNDVEPIEPQPAADGGDSPDGPDASGPAATPNPPPA
ncbi:Inward rectifier potassium channel [Burkholderia savannae]|uniref:ion channel n=1 Tax=Burkholderia savannae TaxID=1637837 RepID=UPI00075E02B3|nr:ion channel [Burkholderia savannae]AOJ82161.1 Inward rectifier potassium channel [Burkholderia savannae]